MAPVRFEARIQSTKNRLIAIPKEVQRRLGLVRKRNNHLVNVSIRPKDTGRWNRHWFKLTFDNEFSIPSDVTHVGPGDVVEVKVHRVVADVAVAAAPRATGADLLLDLAKEKRPGWRTDGAARIDAYLAEEE